MYERRAAVVAAGGIRRNPPAPQIADIDEVPFPAYHLVELKEYYDSVHDAIDCSLPDTFPAFDRAAVLKKIRTDRAILPIITSRGCTNKCSFCYRHMKGFRQHSVAYVIWHIRFLQVNYGIRGFEFADELFNCQRGMGAGVLRRDGPGGT